MLMLNSQTKFKSSHSIRMANIIIKKIETKAADNEF